MTINDGNSEVYETLGDRQIRVLILSPSKKWSDPIKCSLDIVDLNNSFTETMDFEALSYVWGDRSGTSEIIMETYTIPVSSNLEKALRSLRRKTKRRLWVDALCINQNDIDERNAQVRIMADIYRDAKRVLVWLGESSRDFEKAIKWMKKNLHPGFTIEPKGKQPGTKIKRDSEQIEIDKGMEKLRADPYWHRMWTCQEFALAHDDPIIVYGELSFDSGYLWPALEARGMLQDMSMLLTERGRLHNGSSSLFPSLQTSVLIRHAMMRRGQIPYQISPSLGLFLCLTWARQCANRRDKIFALYGLVGKKMVNGEKALLPDYKMTYESIVAEAIAYVVNEEKDMDLFGFLALHQHSMRDEATPSWLPDLFDGDLRSPRCPAHFMTREVCSTPPISIAVSQDRENRPISSDFRTLALMGLIVDRIRDTIALEKTVPLIAAQLDSIQHLIESRTPGRNVTKPQRFRIPVSLGSIILQSLEQSIWKTLTPRMEDDAGSADLSNRDKIVADYFAGRTTGSQERSVYNCLKHICGRTLFITESGIYGVGSPEIKEGDELSILNGLKLPFVLRKDTHGKTNEADIFKMIGAVFVSGLNTETIMRIDGIRTRIREFRIQ
jgi:Heterokaryon incompatibility protein (HET)